MTTSIEWNFLSNHAHVLVCLARNSEARLRDIALDVGITERRVSSIVTDLEAEGVIRISRVGRRNTYSINRRARLRHPLESHQTVGDLLRAIQ